MPGGAALTDRRTLVLAGALATAGAVVAGVVVHATTSSDPSPTASASASSDSGAQVSILPLDPRADPQSVVDTCARFVRDLPDTVAGLDKVTTTPETQRTAAWGTSTIVALRCGIAKPPGFVQGQSIVEIDGISWYQQLDGPVVTWTTVDRTVRAQVTVPVSIHGQGAVLTALAKAVEKDLPATDVSPFPLPSVEPQPADSPS